MSSKHHKKRKNYNQNMNSENRDRQSDIRGEESPVQEPEVPEKESPVQEPEVPEKESPVQEPEVPEEESPAQEPEVPEKESPVQEPEVPEEESPAQEPEVPEKENPAQEPEVPEKESPVQEPEVPEKESPVQQTDVSEINDRKIQKQAAQMPEEKKQEQRDYEKERRLYRKKRRIRNQILAYIVLFVLIGLLAFGIVSAVRIMTTAQKEEMEQSKEEQKEKVEDFFSTEESIPEPEISSEPEPVAAEPTFEEKLDELVNGIISQMTLEDKVAGLFFASPENITKVGTAVNAGEKTRESIAKYPVGGLLYQAKNIRSEAQLKELLTKSAAYAEEGANHHIFIGICEEGGTVAEVASKGLGSKVDSASVIGAAGDPNAAKNAGNVIGDYLVQLGFNLDFAPVADLSLVKKNVVEQRSYGSDPAVVSQYVTAMMEGLKEKGIMPAVLQFPGCGSVTAKTENGLVSTARTAEDFRANEFLVFSAAIAAGADMIMVSHMSVPALDGSNLPASMSEKIVTGILRRELGFEGVIISEAMNKKAVSEYYASDEAAINAFKAGCDMVLVPEDFEKAYKGVLEAVRDGRISEERINDSLKRVYRIKYADRVDME